MATIPQETTTSTTAIMRYTPFREAAVALADCDRRLVFLHEPNSPAAEQYRRIAARLVTRHGAGGTVMITSPAPEDGKTLSAMNLAFCLAERGPVLLIDFDIRHCSVRQRLGLAPASCSLEDVLLGNATPEDCVMSIAGTALHVAINRGEPQRMTDLVGAGRPKPFLNWALRKFKWVILDTPPTFPIADTLEIAQYASVGLLVVRSRKTPARLLRQSIEVLKGKLHFVMLNDAESPSYAVYNKSYYV